MFEKSRTVFKPQSSMVLSEVTQRDLIPVTGEWAEGDIITKGSGGYVKSTGTDISEFYGIAASDAEASSVPNAYVYTFGNFNVDMIKFPEGKSYSDYKVAMREAGIVLEKTQSRQNKEV